MNHRRIAALLGAVAIAVVAGGAGPAFASIPDSKTGVYMGASARARGSAREMGHAGRHRLRVPGAHGRWAASFLFFGCCLLRFLRFGERWRCPGSV
jgi:hypothetical protein